MERPLTYYRAIQKFSAGDLSEVAGPMLQTQRGDIAIMFYLIELPELPVQRQAFGYGFGNFSGGIQTVFEEVFASVIHPLGRVSMIPKPEEFVVA